MGSLAPTQLISLLLAVAAIAAASGFIASAIARRNKRRTRRSFLLGFFCGLMAGSILRGRRRGLKALGALARRGDLRSRRAGSRGGTRRFAVHTLPLAASHVRARLWPPQRNRQVSKRLPPGCWPSLGATRSRMVNAIIHDVSVGTAN